MVMALTRKEFRYICECDRDLPPEEQTVFLLRALTGEEFARTRDMTNLVRKKVNVEEERIETEVIDTSCTAEKICLIYGILGWENFRDDDGKQIPFDKANPGESIAKLPFPVWEELWKQLWKMSHLQDIDRKN